MTEQVVENQSFDQERAFYASRALTVRRCAFDGPADGESAFKECRDITAEDCFFNLRYPFWHVRGLRVRGCRMTELCRAALWYCCQVEIQDTQMHGIKALRECRDVTLTGCDVRSPEFGWSARGVKMTDCAARGEYFFLRGEELDLVRVELQGKYSFQYVKGGRLDHCELDTKDAFWHSRGVTVTDSVIRGEYLGWYSEGLTLVRCQIVGTQPLCYCKGLKLIDCQMTDTDLAFERSEVEAAVTTPILSVKNPRAGTITAPAVGELIMDDPLAKGRVILRPAQDTAEIAADRGGVSAPPR